jgi:hypothetical protein
MRSLAILSAAGLLAAQGAGARTQEAIHLGLRLGEPLIFGPAAAFLMLVFLFAGEIADRRSWRCGLRLSLLGGGMGGLTLWWGIWALVDWVAPM